MEAANTNQNGIQMANVLLSNANGFPAVLRALTQMNYIMEEDPEVSNAVHLIARALLMLKGDFIEAVVDLSTVDVRMQQVEGRAVVELRNQATVTNAGFLLDNSISLTEATEWLVRIAGQLPPNIGGLQLQQDAAGGDARSTNLNELRTVGATTLLSNVGGMAAAAIALLTAHKNRQGGQGDQSGPGDNPTSFCKPWVYTIYNIFICVWIIVYIVYTMLEFGFYQGYPNLLLMIADILSTCCFTIEASLHIFFVYKSVSTENHYRKSWRIFLHSFDFIGSLPWDTFAKTSIFRWSLTIRLLQVRRPLALILKYQKKGVFWGNILKLFEIVFLFMFIAHTVGCLFYHLPAMLPQSERAHSWFKKETKLS